MTTSVRLLGPPSLERDGRSAPSPRGRKAWGLLAYLLLSERPPSRQRLTSLLFTDADDPQGALRWNLAELRRVLGPDVTITGDPVRLQVDVATVDVLSDSVGSEATIGELLEGLDFAACPSFESWLLVERRRVSAHAEAATRELSLAALAAGRLDDAVRLAARAVELDPLQPDHQTLLVRSLAAGGDLAAARAQAARCTDLFRRELGVDPPAAVRQAADVAPVRPAQLTSPAVVRSYLDAGRTAVAAGAVDRGLGQLRQAVTVADDVGDGALQAQTLVTLGGALVHATGARGAGCAEILHRGLHVAEQVGATELAATACRELGFVAVQTGRHTQATAHLRRAEQLTGDDQERAAVLGVRGMSLSDSAHYPEALAVLSRSVACAERAASWRQAAWSQSLIGRIHVLRDDRSQAADVLGACIARVRGEHWTAFLPWPQVLLGELHLVDGDLDEAGELLQHSYVLAVELGDSCWIATAARGLARLAAARGDHVAATDWIDRGLRPDPWYLWVRGYLLDAACTVPSAAARHRRYADDLLRLAGRTGMRELVVRARLHAARLGAREGLCAARWEAADIDNPALLRLVPEMRKPR
ncbi:hypothetical protein BH20ACT9_BH20ACT9_06780 [soil metagenome]